MRDVLGRDPSWEITLHANSMSSPSCSHRDNHNGQLQSAHDLLRRSAHETIARRLVFLLHLLRQTSERLLLDVRLTS